ncbi:hypothetical protein D3C72_563900 [compost metagenome]
MIEFFADLQFQATGHRLIERDRVEFFREIIFAGGVGIRFVVGITVFVAVAQLFHQFGRRVAQVQRHFQRTVFGGGAQCGLEAHVHRVAFRRAGQIGDGLGHRQFAFGAAETLLHFPGCQAQAQGARVGVADVFAGHAHHAPGQVQRIATAVDHSRKPVQRAVGIGAAHRFVQRGDLVVERFAALVETPTGIAEQALQQVGADFAVVFGQVRGVFQQIEQAPAIAIGGRQQHLEAFIAEGQVALAQAPLFGQRTLHQFAQGRFVEALEHVDAGAGEQGVVEFERRVFRGRADENQRAVLDIRQERVLLGLVETMHFVDEQNGAAAVLRGLLLGDFHRLTDLLDPGQHRRDRFEVRVRDFREQSRQGGFAHARRPPENHRMQGTLLQRLAQRLAASKHVFLTDVLIQIGRAQARGQRLRDRGAAKQIHGVRLKPRITNLLETCGEGACSLAT